MTSSWPMNYASCLASSSSLALMPPPYLMLDLTSLFSSLLLTFVAFTGAISDSSSSQSGSSLVRSAPLFRLAWFFHYHTLPAQTGQFHCAHRDKKRQILSGNQCFLYLLCFPSATFHFSSVTFNSKYVTSLSPFLILPNCDSLVPDFSCLPTNSIFLCFSTFHSCPHFSPVSYFITAFPMRLIYRYFP